MVDRKVVEEWLDKAEEDFGFASVSLDDEVTYFAPICFHFHQAAEKYLKAYIVAKELEFRKIHNLPVLLDICCKVNSNLEDIREACKVLNTFYVDTRYPVHWPTKFTLADAKEARDAALSIGNKIKELLG